MTLMKLKRIKLISWDIRMLMKLMRIRLQKIVLLQLKIGTISLTITAAHIMNRLEQKETGLLPQA